MIQQVKPHLAVTMPVVWPTLLDLGRDECKRILRKLELEAYAGVISALRAQGDLTKDKKDLLGELTKVLSISTERHRAEVRRAVNDERLTTIAYHMSGPNSSSEWSIEGRRLVPLMPRLVPQTAFTVTANAVASATANQNASLLLPAKTGNKEVVVCYSYTSTTSTPTSATAPSGSAAATVKSPRPASPASNVVVLPSGSTVYVKSVSCSDEDEKPRKRRRTNSSSSSPVVLKDLAKVAPPLSKTITVPVSGSPKMSNIMQSIANSLPSHMSPVKITFTKPTTQTTNTTTQKVIIVTTSPSSNFVPNILSKSHSHNYAAAMSKLVSTSMLTSASQKQTVFIPASSSPSSAPYTVAVTTVVSSSPSVLMSTIAQSGSSAGVKVASARLPSPKTMVGSPTQILSQFPKQHPQSPKQQQQGSPMGTGAMGQASNTPPSSKPIIQIKEESGVKIITQQMQPSKILPKPSSAGMPSSSSSPIMVVSSNGAIMTTKLVSQPTGTQATYSRPTVSPTIGARMATSASGATYVKTTSGSIITVVPKSMATLGSKIISSNIVSGTTTKITTIPMTSKPNVIVVQKTTDKGTTIQGLPGKNVVTTLLNAGGEKTLQGIPGSKPAIITASRPITKMIVTQPKGMGSGVQPTTKIIPTKIVYGQQGKTQVLIKPKPIFQTAVVSEQTRQLVSETLQHTSRVADAGPAYAQERAHKEESGAIAKGRSPPAEGSHGIVHMKEKGEAKPRQQTIDLSQMAVPLQMAQDKKQQALSSSEMSTVETEPPIEYVTDGKASRAGPSSVGVGDVGISASQQQGAPSQNTSHTPVMAKSIPSSSAVTVTRIVQLASAGQLIHSKHAEETVMEEGELEGDTLDPQTGLFYRSIQPAAVQPPAPHHQSQSHSEPQSEQGRHIPHSTQTPPQPPQLHCKSQMSLPSTATLAKEPPQLQEQYQPKPQAPGQSLKERPSSASGSPQLAGLGTPTKPPSLTPQLPKLQQAPTSHHRPIHTQLSQPPPLQAHHPVGADKTPATSQAPIITQGASITKITFGGSSSHQSLPVSSSGEATAKLVPAEPSSSGSSGGEKPSVSDILKISMMEAEIDPSAEPMVVDSSSDCSPYVKALELGALGGSGPVISSSGASLHHSSHSKPQHDQFSRIQGLAAKSKEDLDVIEVIPQYSIMPDSSQSNVVMEPSGFLEITDYTSQRLDEESVMEQEVDSSNDEATAVSPMEEGCPDQSQ
ncbi:BRCA2-interacting transcriptional repressor EMSY-like isoform X4 [Coregonus clupeaformis]|uniref:BRCA2-interacting transcriptional repressor EMSY-like isoform X4 n=1 Tax=Coregonus clupeaformis TaxID=59861 RepID=UPI001BE0F217|nr:BRCA2-interacting transcriptional repressor EMSY-like isoform X4 [Coregonus clupeaformis]